MKWPGEHYIYWQTDDDAQKRQRIGVVGAEYKMGPHAELTFSVDGETYSGTSFFSLELMDLE